MEEKAVGVLLNSVQPVYESILWENLVFLAKEAGYKLISFSFGRYDKTGQHISSSNNFIRKFIDQNTIGGLIVFSSSIGFFAGPEALSEFLHSFNPIPVVSIGFAYKDIPSVIIDNKSGMHTLIEHLINTHHYHNFAYLAGPVQNVDAVERMECLEQVFKKYAIELKPENIYYGDFCKECVKEAIRVLLDERKATFDCLICANDCMALEAINELRARNYKIPEQIAVTGFDNVSGADVITKALTSVGISYKEFTAEAFKMITALMAGKETSMLGICASYPVYRQSCGCFNTTKYIPGPTALLRIDSWSKETLVGFFRGILEKLELVMIPENKKIAWAASLAEGFWEARDRNSPTIFLQVMYNIIILNDFQNIDLFTWQALYKQFFVQIEPWIETTADKAFIMSLSRQVEIFFNLHIKSYFQLYKIDLRERYYNISLLSSIINNQYDQAELETILCYIMPSLKIKYFYLAIYGKTEPDFIKFYFIYENGRYVYNPDLPPVREADFIDSCLANIKETRQFLALPLFIKDERLGVILVDTEEVDGQSFEMLTSLISVILYSLKLFNQLEDYTQDLEKEVKLRTIDLVKTNERLQEEIISNKRKAEELEAKNHEIERLNAILDKKSKTDTLTQLYNRYALYEFLEKELSDIKAQSGHSGVNDKSTQTANNGVPYFSVILFDIDHFKKINDTYGHLFGDKVLKIIGDVLSNKFVIRESDIASRLGGDEFIVLLRNADSNETMLIARRIQHKLAHTKISCDNGNFITVTASIGISEYLEDDKDISAVIERADHALYYAKNHGRNLIFDYKDIRETGKVE